MVQYTHLHRVRYRECDPMGIVYHAHYVDFFEAARTEALRAVGMPYRELEEMGIIMPVIEVSIRYHQSARYDDLLEIKTSFEDEPKLRVHVYYEVRRQGEPRLLTTGTVALCFVDTRRNRPVPAPEPLLQAFERARAEQEAAV